MTFLMRERWNLVARKDDQMHNEVKIEALKLAIEYIRHSDESRSWINVLKAAREFEAYLTNRVSKAEPKAPELEKAD